MQLTAHKTVTQFMRYVHTEDNPVRAAAEIVAARRKSVLRDTIGSVTAPAEPRADATASGAFARIDE
jgi:hypothetical protein